MTVMAILRRLFVPEGPEERECRLRAEGLLVEERYVACRAFEVEMYEDEGRHLFVELEDGAVLYLGGQYLFDYGIDLTHGDRAGVDNFPSSEFTVISHKAEGYVLRIECSGRQLPLERVFPAYRPEECAAGAAPLDEIRRFTSFTYDDLCQTEGRLA